MAYPNDMFEGFSAEETEELQSILGDIAKKESGFYEPPDPTKIDNAESQLTTMYENGQITAKQFEKARNRLDDLRYKIDKTKDKPINYDDIAEYYKVFGDTDLDIIRERYVDAWMTKNIPIRRKLKKYQGDQGEKRLRFEEKRKALKSYEKMVDSSIATTEFVEKPSMFVSKVTDVTKGEYIDPETNRARKYGFLARLGESVKRQPIHDRRQHQRRSLLHSAERSVDTLKRETAVLNAARRKIKEGKSEAEVEDWMRSKLQSDEDPGWPSPLWWSNATNWLATDLPASLVTPMTMTEEGSADDKAMMVETPTAAALRVLFGTVPSMLTTTVSQMGTGRRVNIEGDPYKYAESDNFSDQLIVDISKGQWMYDYLKTNQFSKDAPDWLLFGASLAGDFAAPATPIGLGKGVLKGSGAGLRMAGEAITPRLPGLGGVLEQGGVAAIKAASPLQSIRVGYVMNKADQLMETIGIPKERVLQVGVKADDIPMTTGEGRSVDDYWARMPEDERGMFKKQRKKYNDLKRVFPDLQQINDQVGELVGDKISSLYTTKVYLHETDDVMDWTDVLPKDQIDTMKAMNGGKNLEVEVFLNNIKRQKGAKPTRGALQRHIDAKIDDLALAGKKEPVIASMINKAESAMKLRIKNRFKLDGDPRQTPLPKLLDDVQTETFKARLSRMLVDGDLTEKTFRGYLKSYVQASKNAKTMEKLSKENKVFASLQDADIMDFNRGLGSALSKELSEALLHFNPYPNMVLASKKVLVPMGKLGRASKANKKYNSEFNRLLGKNLEFSKDGTIAYLKGAPSKVNETKGELAQIYIDQVGYSTILRSNTHKKALEEILQNNMSQQTLVWAEDAVKGHLAIKHLDGMKISQAGKAYASSAKPEYLRGPMWEEKKYVPRGTAGLAVGALAGGVPGAALAAFIEINLKDITRAAMSFDKAKEWISRGTFGKWKPDLGMPKLQISESIEIKEMMSMIEKNIPKIWDHYKADLGRVSKQLIDEGLATKEDAGSKAFQVLVRDAWNTTRAQVLTRADQVRTNNFIKSDAVPGAIEDSSYYLYVRAMEGDAYANQMKAFYRDEMIVQHLGGIDAVENILIDRGIKTADLSRAEMITMIKNFDSLIADMPDSKDIAYFDLMDQALKNMYEDYVLYLPKSEAWEDILKMWYGPERFKLIQSEKGKGTRNFLNQIKRKGYRSRLIERQAMTGERELGITMARASTVRDISLKNMVDMTDDIDDLLGGVRTIPGYTPTKEVSTKWSSLMKLVEHKIPLSKMPDEIPAFNLPGLRTTWGAKAYAMPLMDYTLRVRRSAFMRQVFDEFTDRGSSDVVDLLPHPSRVNIEADMLIVRNNYKRFAERMQQKIGIVLPDFADEFADLMAKKHESILRTATASKRLDLMRWTSDRFAMTGTTNPDLATSMNHIRDWFIEVVETMKDEVDVFGKKLINAIDAQDDAWKTQKMQKLGLKPKEPSEGASVEYIRYLETHGEIPDAKEIRRAVEADWRKFVNGVKQTPDQKGVRGFYREIEDNILGITPQGYTVKNPATVTLVGETFQQMKNFFRQNGAVVQDDIAWDLMENMPMFRSMKNDQALAYQKDLIEGVDAMMDMANSSQISTQINNLRKYDKNIGSFAKDIFMNMIDSSRRTMSQGMLGGWPMPNIAYHSINIMTAPLIKLASVGNQYAWGNTSWLFQRMKLSKMSPNDVLFEDKIGKQWRAKDVRDFMTDYDLGHTRYEIEFGEQQGLELLRMAKVGADGMPEHRLKNTFKKWLPYNENSFTRFAINTDNFFREAAAIEALKRGHSKAEAAMIARKSMLDYGALGPKERAVMQRFIAFWSWNRMMQTETLNWTAKYLQGRMGAKAYGGLVRANMHYHQKLDSWAYGDDKAKSRLIIPFLTKHFDFDGQDFRTMGPSIPAIEKIGSMVDIAFGIVSLFDSEKQTLVDAISNADSTPTTQFIANLFRADQKFQMGKQYPMVPINFVLLTKQIGGENVWEYTLNRYDIIEINMERRRKGKTVFGPTSESNQYHFSTQEGYVQYLQDMYVLTLVGLGRGITSQIPDIYAVVGYGEGDDTYRPKGRRTPEDNSGLRIMRGALQLIRADAPVKLQDPEFKIDILKYYAGDKVRKATKIIGKE